jgi:hydroxymethylpyrimidine pyrophosphatase-like HAD family hydrolase
LRVTVTVNRVETMPLIESIPDNLNNINIASSIIFSDMTGTLLYQTEDGNRFPVETRNLIANYIALGGTFVLVTGDSFEVVSKQFINHLPSISHSFFVLTESGAEIHKIFEAKHKQLFKAKPLSLTCKKQSLEKCIDFIDSTYNINCKEIITGSRYESIDKFLMGGRLLINEITAITNKPFFLEVADYKVTVYAEAGSITGSPTDVLLSKLRNDKEFQAIASNNNSILMRGAIYFEIIANSKEQGIRTFFTVSDQDISHLKNSKSNVDVIILGDSPNDEGMYLYPFNEVFQFHRQTSVFFGIEEDFVQSIAKTQRYHNDNFYRLSGTHELGSLEVFRKMIRPRENPRP